MISRVSGTFEAILVLSLTGLCPAQQSSGLPRTVAEASNFKATSTSAEVEQFIQICSRKAPHVNQFEFGKTVEGRAMTAVSIADKPWVSGQPDDRAVILVIANIHSGECAGKEALLAMIRDLTSQPDHRWLRNLVLVFVPNYNADANDRIGKNNRRGQIGPENGMGRRENAQDLDLNRDFVKLESPEARALVKLIDQISPHLFIDCHTTNGSKHRYALTYDIPHNPATAEPIRNFLRNKMMPEVTSSLEAKGVDTFYYGNFNADHTQWTTFGHEPRYSTEYVGLRGRLAVLSEAYSYISYEKRIEATEQFVSECINFVHENAETVSELLAAIDRDLVRIATRQPSRVSIALNARAESFDRSFQLKGFKDEQPHEYDCEFVGKYVATRSVPLPLAYLIPGRHLRVVDRLLMHGIKVERLNKSTDASVTVDVISAVNRVPQAFQKHRMMQAQSVKSTERREVQSGMFVVRTNQPLSRLAAYLLECESDDGLLFWNFFDRDIAVNREHPVLRIDQPTVLETEPVTKINERSPVTLDMIGGPNPILRRQSPPKWRNGNQIQVELYGRQFLMDAESMSFEQMVEPVFDADELKRLLMQLDVSEEDASKLVAEKPLESDDRKTLVFDTDEQDFVYSVEAKQVLLIGPSENSGELYEFSPDQKQIAYLLDSKLQITELESFNRFVPSRFEDPKTLVGKLDWVYQEELYGRGNFKGYWWSPNSEQVAFLKLQTADVDEFTISDYVPIQGEHQRLSYPKAGTPNPVVSVGIVRSSTGADFAVDLSGYGDEQLLISNVCWNQDGSRLLLQVQNREQTWLDLVAVEPAGGATRLLFRDQTPAWIESPGAPKFLDDGSFLWLSPRNGYRHIYHYDSKGQQIAQLTHGDWEVRSLLEVDPEKGFAYFSAAKESPRDVDGYRLNLTSGEVQRITTGSGTHQLSFNDDRTMFIDSVSTAMRPSQFQLHRADGQLLRKLAVSSDDRFEYLNIVGPEFFTIDSDDAQPLDAMIIRPAGFDPARKYPVLVHVYSGPQAPVVRNRFGRNWFLWHQALANRGYVVFACDNQSASYRSSKRVWPVHRNLGVNELADIEKGVNWLKQQPWIDGDRIGIWGWSYGGFMTAYALTHSNSFKVGIAGAPVTDWRNYDSIYTERLMGLPSENAVGYDASSVVKAASDLSGKLLLIHGSVDDNVHVGNTIQFALELQKSGKQFDLMIYPQNRHAITDDEQSQHLRQLMFDFVIENL